MAEINNTYDFASSGNRDRMISYDNQEISYDALGNPLQYKGKALQWEYVRQLRKIGNDITYTYNADGIRKSKQVGDVLTKYITLDGQLLGEESGGVATTYIYGASGLLGFKKDGQAYTYIRNIQGDITHILNSTNVVVAKYIYDAWGNHKVFGLVAGVMTELCDTSANAQAINAYHTSNIAMQNPFRYRGYYYDTESGFYYLQTRYYDPQVGRFINADDISYLDPENINGLNLYAYCTNNPVMMTDSTGKSPMPNWLKWLIGGIAFIVAVVLTAVTGGALAPVFLNMGASIIGIGLFKGTINAINGGSFWQGFVDGMADGALMGGLSALGGAVIRTIKLFKNGVTIGENMTRVGKYAKSTGQVTYKGMPGYKAVRLFKGENVARKLSMAHNETFIKRMMKWGIKITDIGIDVARTSRSWYYFMESILVNGYNFLKILS